MMWSGITVVAERKEKKEKKGGGQPSLALVGGPRTTYYNRNKGNTRNEQEETTTPKKRKQAKRTRSINPCPRVCLFLDPPPPKLPSDNDEPSFVFRPFPLCLSHVVASREAPSRSQYTRLSRCSGGAAEPFRLICRFRSRGG